MPDDNGNISFAALLMLYYNFASLIFPSVIIITLYTSYNRFFQKCKELYGRVVSRTKHGYSFSKQFLSGLMRSLKSISDE